MSIELPTLDEIDEQKSLLIKEYEEYLNILSIKDINERAQKVFEWYSPTGWSLYDINLVKELFGAERENVVDPLNDGFPLIQYTELLHYIMNARDILGIEYKCQSCLMRPTCCDYDKWMELGMYEQCEGVQILSDRFMCFIARKYILA